MANVGEKLVKAKLLYIIFLWSISCLLASGAHAEDFYIGENLCQDGSSDGSGKNMVGKPINLFAGTETLKHTDLSIGVLYPINIQRQYVSSSVYDSPLGYGWAFTYDKRLYLYPDGSAVVRKNCGQKVRFTWNNNRFIAPAGDYGTLAQNVDGTFTYTDKDGSSEIYDVYGRIVTAKDPTGNSLYFTYGSDVRGPLTGLSLFNLNMISQIVSYDYRLTMIEERDSTGTATGSRVTFSYDLSSGRINGIWDNTGRSVSYNHDTIGNLTAVNGPAGTSSYEYNNQLNPHSLTSINEGQGEYINSYDSNGRVYQQTHANGQIGIEYLPNQQVRVTTKIEDPEGNELNTQVRLVTFNSNGVVVSYTDTFGNVSNYIRDPQTSKILREEYWENTETLDTPNLVLKAATDYTYDIYGNVKTKTEASDPNSNKWDSLKKTTWYYYEYELNPSASPATFNKIANEIVNSVVDPSQYRYVKYNYDDATGNLLSLAEMGLLGDGTPYNYTTSYSYYSNGLLQSIDDPRTDVQAVTTFTYDPTTNYRLTMTQPLIGTTTYSSFDSLGNPQSVTDPNGNTTSYTYDSLGRVRSVRAPGDTSATQYYYVQSGCSSCGGANQIDHITLPEGNTITYSYDANSNLASITDSAGNSINYSNDSVRNKLSEEIKDASGALQKSLSYQYDALNRLSKTINPDSSFTQYDYDSRGNRTGFTDAKGNSTSYTYDALNRLASMVQPGTATTTYAYNSNNNLTAVTDANGNTTTYKYDDKGRVYEAISPDTGTIAYQYDPAGNMISKTDAKGITITYSYDAANRLTNIHFPSDGDIVYAYDRCLNGKGRLCSITDASGTTNYEWTAKGQIKKETKTIDSVQYVTQYTYDQNGNLKTMTYPSGRVITYNVTNDRVTSVLNNAANLAANITYKPYGGMTSITFGNGLTQSTSYDNQYRITRITAGTVMNLSYGQYDANGNITGITNNLDATKNKSFGYDALDRLTSATASGLWGSLFWTYDGVGNRLMEKSTAYSYAPGTDKLADVGGTSFGYDDNGNTTSQAARSYTYNQNQRLIQVVDGSMSARYTYNGMGQRVKKTVNGVTTIFHYDQRGHLIAESDGTGATTAEYIYLSSLPLAKIERTNTYFYTNDHLATPQKMTDSSGAIVWSADYKPFGEATVTISTVTNNLRFPGQYYDAETGLHYNYYRDYNALLDRFIQTDPIGLKGGPNLYVYAWANSVSLFDSKGLDANTYTYGEIRSWAITSISDFTAPGSLGDAKASIGAACSRGNSCASVDGSNATAPSDRAAWSNIVNASGSDQSGSGNFMCVGTTNCWFVHSCYRCCGRNRTLSARGTALSPSGSVTVAGKGTLYFYNDSLMGWCSQSDYASGCRGN